MKLAFKLFAMGVVLSSSAAFAVNDSGAKLTCYDTNREGSKNPIMTLSVRYNSKKLTDGATLSGDVRFPNNEERYGYLPRVIRGYKPSNKITTNRSPYKGNYDYMLAKGIRLILSADVSPRGIANADVDGRREQHAAILDVESQVHGLWSGGSVYLRMRCESVAE